MVKAALRGHPVYIDDHNNIRYADDNSLYDDSRPCKYCGKYPTEEGHDACLGNIPNADNACCGHGENALAYIMKENSSVNIDICEFVEKVTGQELTLHQKTTMELMREAGHLHVCFPQRVGRTEMLRIWAEICKCIKEEEERPNVTR